MRIFLAGQAYSPSRNTEVDFSEIVETHHPYILESFYYVNETTEKLIPLFGDFMLDSGAFTFMQGQKGHADWNSYIDRYADFINKNHIEKFFELDIDSVVGYPKVLEFRRRLESLTGRQCIPVWHSNRGIEEYKRMCNQYDYVALGGIVGNEWAKKAENCIPWFINEAHKRKAKVHGLGFTKLKLLPRFHFDSVDSTAWTTGNRFGFVYRFTGASMRKIDCPSGKRLKDPRRVAMINYTEWIKFQRWADTNL